MGIELELRLDWRVRRLGIHFRRTIRSLAAEVEMGKEDDNREL